MQKARSPSARGGGLPGEQRGTIASKAIGHTGRPMMPTLSRPGSRRRRASRSFGRNQETVRQVAATSIHASFARPNVKARILGELAAWTD
jgi:hypothetical protein